MEEVIKVLSILLGKIEDDRVTATVVRECAVRDVQRVFGLK